MSVQVWRELRRVLAGIGPSVLVGDATGKKPPYLVLWGNLGVTDSGGRAIGGCGPRRFELGVTCVAPVALGALDLAEKVRNALTPNGLPHSLTVDGHKVTVEHADSRPVMIDRDVAVEETGTFPAYTVEIFHVHVEKETS